MPSTRKRTVGYPKKFIEPVVVNGVEVQAGYWQPAYQEDIFFTPDEERARDAEEARHTREMAEEAASVAARQAARAVAKMKLRHAEPLADEDLVALFGEE